MSSLAAAGRREGASVGAESGECAGDGIALRGSLFQGELMSQLMAAQQSERSAARWMQPAPSFRPPYRAEERADLGLSGLRRHTANSSATSGRHAESFARGL